MSWVSSCFVYVVGVAIQQALGVTCVRVTRRSGLFLTSSTKMVLPLCSASVYDEQPVYVQRTGCWISRVSSSELLLSPAGHTAGLVRDNLHDNRSNSRFRHRWCLTHALSVRQSLSLLTQHNARHGLELASHSNAELALSAARLVFQ